MKLRTRVLLGIALAVVAIATRFAIPRYAFRTYRIPTVSMAPTIPANSTVIARVTDEAHVGDIITFIYPVDRKTFFAKRIVAAGGDLVAIRDKKLFVNGRELEEPYVIHEDDEVYPNENRLPEPYRSRDQLDPFRVPPGTFFVLGDNRDRSNDSRYWGCVPQKNITGRVVAAITPQGFRRIR